MGKANKKMIDIDILMLNYQSQQDLIANANQKLYFLFGIDSALMLSFIFKYNDIVKSHILNSFFLNGLFFLSFLSVTLAMFLILYEVSPKISDDKTYDSFISFLSLSSQNPYNNNFQNILNVSLYDEENAKIDIMKQTIHLSKLLKSKIDHTKWVVELTIFSSICIGFLLIMMSVVHTEYQTDTNTTYKPKSYIKIDF